MRRVRYQFGCLKLRKDFWTFRFYETGSDGKRRYRRIRVGTKAQYPTRAEAMKAVEGLRLSINTGSFQMTPVRFGAVIQRYQREELPERFSTRACYTSMLKRCIEPKWSEVPVNDIRTLEVEHWLKSLTSAPKSKANVRNLMHLLFEFARRWDLTDKNPIELVRQSSRRQRIPKRLSVEEFQRLLGCLSEPCRTMAILAACLGLRIGEVMGLKWEDVDLLNGSLNIHRSVYQYHVGPAKTPNSEAALPLAPEIVSALLAWRSRAVYRAGGDWMFASDKGGLRDVDKLRENVLQPAAKKAEIGKIGWHSLRHSFASALDAAGARMKVAQELMRHANISTTMDVYTGAMERDKRDAAAQVAKSFLGAVQ
ncbi:MAG: hypothetical protein A3H28_15515 [Acidobacteria bacterium RIFCSPLOWO2_02_FULL_61_28]|nr:MAG: hypothetical protein A3H28_15515 [Acidobacteria bacterium RIFCSPLOWO2_02_FULL_61_28]